MRNYWLFKSEPGTFGIDDLKKLPDKTDHWDGVRNYQARNMMRDDMKPGDLGFFYHSNCKVPGIVGIIEIVSKGYPDFTAWDEKSPYFDPKGSPGKPRWYMVDVRYKKTFKRIISLSELKQHGALTTMKLLQKGNRLSITPISPDEWQYILDLE